MELRHAEKLPAGRRSETRGAAKQSVRQEETVGLGKGQVLPPRTIEKAVLLPFGDTEFHTCVAQFSQFLKLGIPAGVVSVLVAKEDDGRRQPGAEMLPRIYFGVTLVSRLEGGIKHSDSDGK